MGDIIGNFFFLMIKLFDFLFVLSVFRINSSIFIEFLGDVFWMVRGEF